MKSLVLALSLLFASPAVMALGISPMDQHLSQSNKTGALMVVNTNAVSARYQVKVDRLTIDAQGNRVLTPTRDLVFYPASVFTLEAGRTQTLRWKRDQPGTEEHIYVVDVVEDPQHESNAALITVKPRALLTWNFTTLDAAPSLKAISGGGTTLTNTGTALARLRNVAIDGKPLASSLRLAPGERFAMPAGRTVSYELQGVAYTLAVE